MKATNVLPCYRGKRVSTLFQTIFQGLQCHSTSRPFSLLLKTFAGICCHSLWYHRPQPSHSAIFSSTGGGSSLDTLSVLRSTAAAIYWDGIWTNAIINPSYRYGSRISCWNGSELLVLQTFFEMRPHFRGIKCSERRIPTKEEFYCIGNCVNSTGSTVMLLLAWLDWYRDGFAFWVS